MKHLITISLLVSLSAHAQVFRADQIRMFWKGSDGKPYMTFENLLKEHPRLIWVMNGGMFTEDHEPVGLYIEDGKKWHKQVQLDKPSVNFGIRPQGVFYIGKNGAGIAKVPCKEDGMIHATESGPMLVIDGKRNPNLPEGRSIPRNGVGILPDGTIFFALETMTFRAFADLFIRKGCKQALFLDGGVSRVWTPGTEPWSGFGVMIGVEK